MECNHTQIVAVVALVVTHWSTDYILLNKFPKSTECCAQKHSSSGMLCGVRPHGPHVKDNVVLDKCHSQILLIVVAMSATSHML